MKQCYWLLAFVLAAGVVLNSSPADASDADSPSQSLIQAERLEFLAVGGAFEEETRVLGSPTGVEEELNARHYYGFLSADILSWCSIQFGAGQSEVKGGPGTGYGEGDFMWMAQVKAALWEHEVHDPMFLESMVRLETALSYWDHETEAGSQDAEWDELRATFGLSVEFFVHDFGTIHSVYPYSIVLFGGVIYSELDMDVVSRRDGSGAPFYASTSLEEEDTLGLRLGFDVNLSHNLSVGWETRTYDETTHNLNVAFHF